MSQQKKGSKPKFKTQEHRADLLKMNMARRKEQQKNRMIEKNQKES